MFIVNKLFHRAVHTSQKFLVTGVLSSVSRVLGSDFIGVIQRRMREECFPRPAPQTQTIILGNPSAALAQSMIGLVDDRSAMFMVLINNLDVAGEYCSRIVRTYLSAQLPEKSGGPSNTDGVYGDDSAPPVPLQILFPFPNEETEIRNALVGLETAFVQKSGEVLSDAIGVLFNQLIKAKLRPLITEAFRDVDYFSTPTTSALLYPSDDINPELAAEQQQIEQSDLVTTRFTLPFSALIHPFKSVLTDAPFNKLLNLTANYLARLLEKKIYLICTSADSSSTTSSAMGGVIGGAGGVSELGAIRLERDVAGLVNVVVGMGRWYGVREAFARCVQICLVLGWDEEEVGVGVFGESVSAEGEGGEEDGVESGGVEWKLTLEERRRIRGMLRR